MKNIFTIFSAILFLVSFSVSSQVAGPEILHYKFNGTGTLVPNYATSPPAGTANATIVGAQTQGTVGQCGGALIGTGTTTDYVNTAWTTSLSGSWTISFWTSNIPSSSTLFYIWGDVNASSFRCFTNGVAGANNWMMRGGGMTDVLLTGGATTASKFNVIVYDAVAGQTRGYVNAVQVATVTQSSSNVSGSGPFKVGHYGTNTGLPSAGLMDEFRIYSRALTLNEIQQTYTNTATTSTLNMVSCGPYFSAGSNTYNTSGTYTESVNECSNVAMSTINLTVITAPTLSVNASSYSICSGSSVSLTTAGTATNFLWNTSATTSSIVVTPAVSSNYTVTTTGACSLSRTVGINVTATPTINISNSAPNLCNGQTATLVASGAGSYSWNTSSTNDSLIVTPSSTTGYTVTGMNGVCTGSNTVNITVSPVPTVVVSASPPTVCAGQVSTLSASGASVYAWNTGPVATSITVSPYTTTNYTVIGMNGNCFDTQTISLTVDPTPTVSAVLSASQVCAGYAVTVTASGATSYSWNTGSTINPNVVYPQTPTTYSITGFLGNCSSVKTVSIAVIPTPSVTIVGTGTAVCLGKTMTLTAGGVFSYAWSTGATTNTLLISPTTATNYFVWGAGPNGCVDTANIFVPVNPNPSVSVASSASLLCKGATATLTPAGADTYQWNNLSTAPTLTIKPSVTTSYTVTGTDVNGCKGTAVITQTVSECIGINEQFLSSKIEIYPNPNNGLFTIRVTAADGADLEIFNATGSLVYLTQAVNTDTLIDLRELPGGLYYLRSADKNNPQVLKFIKE